MARMITSFHTLKFQHLLAFALVATLAFAAGSLIGVSGRIDWLFQPRAGVAAPTSERAARVDPNNPITSAGSSAYDGRSYKSARPRVTSHNDTPIKSAGSSAYDSRSPAPRRAVTQQRNGHNPITCAACSAYQPNR